MVIEPFGPLAPERLYIHTPWCRTICPYCAFPVQALRHSAPVADFASQIVHEWNAWHQHFTDRPRLWRSIYFGGGTPSLLPLAQLETILSALGPTAVDCEVTLEANPEDITLDRARGWRALGITRLSIGVQSFQPLIQKALGRAREAHHVAQALSAVREHFDNWNLDLIYGTRWHNPELWQADLTEIRRWQPPHLSAYALTVEPNTPYARWATRTVSPAANDDTAAEHYSTLRQELDWLAPYEVSNWSQPDTAARHNSAYWNRESCLALGPGAQGLLRNTAGAELRYGNHPAQADWTRGVAERGVGADWWDPVDAAARRIEEIMLGLRSARGTALATIGTTHNARLQSWQDAGFGYTVGEHFFLYPHEWIRADTYVEQLLQEIP